MKFEIKHRFTGSVLFEIEIKSLRLCVEAAVRNRADLSGAYLSGAYLSGADLRGAYLRGADLGGADLRGADLSGAYLRGADLSGAYLSGADLSGADLRGADLRGANLSGAYLSAAYLRGANLRGANLSGANLRAANGIKKYLTTPLYILQDQVGKIRAYKLTCKDGTGPYYHDIKYEVGKNYTEGKADCDEQKQCAAGISLATLDWCIKAWKEGYKIFVAEFENKDIAAIPIGSDGKFRVHRCKIVGEKDLKELGVIKE